MEKLGFPKDGKTEPCSRIYWNCNGCVNFDSYIDGGDGQMIIQMGIRGT